MIKIWLHLDSTCGTIRSMKMRSLHIKLFALLVIIVLLSGCTASTASRSMAQLNENPGPFGLMNQADDAPSHQSNNNEAGQGTDGDQVRGNDDLSEESSTGEESLTDTALELTETSQELWAAGETEKAIEALDHAYSLILTAPADAEGMSVQQKDDLRFVISKRLLEIYTSRLSAVNGKYKEIPLVVNEHVEREIKLFQTLERDFFLESYRRSVRRGFPKRLRGSR